MPACWVSCYCGVRHEPPPLAYWLISPYFATIAARWGRRRPRRPCLAPVETWLLAIVHANPPEVISGVLAGQLDLSWTRLFHDPVCVSAPGLTTALVLVSIAVVVCATWRRELSCAF